MDKPRIGAALLLLGSACLIVVMLTHIAEALHIFPSIGWGLPDSAGHYLDLASAVLGCALLPLGFLFSRKKNAAATKSAGCNGMIGER
jgi:hypothetical protein